MQRDVTWNDGTAKEEVGRVASAFLDGLRVQQGSGERRRRKGEGEGTSFLSCADCIKHVAPPPTLVSRDE
jgi:hypothetical protein